MGTCSVASVGRTWAAAAIASRVHAETCCENRIKKHKEPRVKPYGAPVYMSNFRRLAPFVIEDRDTVFFGDFLYI